MVTEYNIHFSVFVTVGWGFVGDLRILGSLWFSVYLFPGDWDVRNVWLGWGVEPGVTGLKWGVGELYG